MAEFNHLAPILHPVAERAAALDLTITSYNSGVTGKGAEAFGNGIRVFRSPGGKTVDHFRGDHLAHMRNLGEVFAFLAGFEAGRAK